MFNIKPKTYNDVVCMVRCVKLKEYIPDLDDKTINKVYEHIRKNSKNCILVTQEMIYYVNASGQPESAMVLDTLPTGKHFDYVIVGLRALKHYTECEK